MRLLHLIAAIFVSILFEIVGIHQIDLQRDDDDVEVHFLTWRLALDCECLCASALLQLLKQKVSLSV